MPTNPSEPPKEGEISYDLVMDEDMPFVEGVFRLPGEGWQVLVASRYDIAEPQVVPQRWESGALGVLMRFPRERRLNREVVEQTLSAAFGIETWKPVSGPDSIQLR